MKKSAEHLNGIQIGATRIFAAGLCFLPFALFHFAQIPRKKLPAVILSGLLGNLLPAFLFATAIERDGESSLASILNSLTPLFVIVIGVLFFRTKVQGKKVAGVLVGFAGLIILSVTRQSGAANSFGLVLILIATVFYGITVNLVSHFLKGIDGWKIATVSLSFMAIPAGIVMWQQHVFSMIGSEGPRGSIFLAALLGVAGSAIATGFFYILIQKAGGLFASLVTYVIPIVAIFWALLAREEVTVFQVACLGIILAGVYLANR